MSEQNTCPPLSSPSLTLQVSSSITPSSSTPDLSPGRGEPHCGGRHGAQETPVPGVGLWHVDSGASSHLPGCRAWFTELHQCYPCTVVTANHGTLKCTQRGTVTLNTERGRIHVRNVLYVPSLGVNLLSVSAIVNAGMRVRFTKGGCRISTSHNKLIVQAVARNNIYCISATPEPSESAYSVTAGTSSPLNWVIAHGRRGHLNPRDMQAVHDKGMALGFTVPSAGSPADIDHCAGCLAGKSHCSPFPTKASHRATQPLELVHSDVCGHIHEGDNTSRKRYIVRTDGGGEYTHDQFNTYLNIMGIQRQMSAAQTPQQNGVAERVNRTIMEAARSMLHAAGLPLSFWEYAVMTAVYLRNRSPTEALTNATPYKAWRGEKPDLSHLRVFGCRAYMHLDKTKRSKLEPRSVPVIFIGYSTEAKAWLVYNPVASGSKKTHVSRDVTFHEGVAGSTLLTAAVSAAVPAAIEGKTSSSSSVVTPAAGQVDAEKPSSIDQFLLVSDTDSDSESDSDVEPAVLPVQHGGQCTGVPGSSHESSRRTVSGRSNRHQSASQPPRRVISTQAPVQGRACTSSAGFAQRAGQQGEGQCPASGWPFRLRLRRKHYRHRASQLQRGYAQPVSDSVGAGHAGGAPLHQGQRHLHAGPTSRRQAGHRQ